MTRPQSGILPEPNPYPIFLILRVRDPGRNVLAISRENLTGRKHADTPPVLCYDLTPPREFVGPKAVHDDFDNFFKNVKSPKVEFVNLHVDTDGKLGFARSIQHFTGTGTDGKPIDMIFRVTNCLHKVKGKWKIL